MERKRFGVTYFLRKACTNKPIAYHQRWYTFACLAVEYRMPIDVLAKILGHSNTNMTRHYAKFSEQLIGREMRKMNGQIFSGDVLSLNQ